MPENEKLITLARAALARGGRESAAAVRDETGRTHVAAQVELAHLRLTALRAAVVMAAASGAHGIEAAAVASAGAGIGVDSAAGVQPGGGSEAAGIDPGSLAVLADLALPDCVVISCDRSGRVTGVLDMSGSSAGTQAAPAGAASDSVPEGGL